MDFQKSNLSLKERLLQYQENARKQKEYEKKLNLSVSQLDSSMTDVSKYSRASTVTNRKATTVSADMVNRLDPNLLEDFNASANFNASLGSISFLQSPIKGYQSPTKGFRSPIMGLRSPAMSKLDLSSKRAELAKRDEPELRGLFLQALANSSDEGIQQMVDDPQMTFNDLRSRYLRSIFALIPDYGDVSDLSKERRMSIVREEAHKRDDYVKIRDAWDMYEQKVLARPHDATTDDKEIVAQIKETETNISMQWANLAEQVVDDILHGGDETMAEEGDDSLLACVEAARRMAIENEHRQSYKDENELKRQHLPLEETENEENPEGINEESGNGSQYNSASSFSLHILPEDRTENSDGDSKWAEEARRQRLLFQARVAAGEAQAYGDDDEGSDQDEHIIDQAKKLRRAYVRHLANQKDSDSESEEDEDVDNISKWINEARQLRHLSRSKLHMSMSGNNSSLTMDGIKLAEEIELEAGVRNDREESSRSFNGVSRRVSDSDTSESDDSDDSDSLYLWREEARRLKEKSSGNMSEKDKNIGEEVIIDGEESDSSFYEEVVRKAMELEKKYNERRAMLNNDEDTSSDSEDDKDRSHWLKAARDIKSKGQCKLDDPEKQAWLDEAKRLREETAGTKEKVQGHDGDMNDDANDEEIALKAIKLHRGDKLTNGESSFNTYSKEEISEWVQKARMNEAERRRTVGSSESWLEEARRIRSESVAAEAQTTEDRDEPEHLDYSDIDIVNKAKELRREYIRERLKYMSKTDKVGDEIDDLTRWINAARTEKERRLRKATTHSSRKKCYEHSESTESDDDDIEELQKQSSKAKKESRKKKKKDKKKRKKSRKSSSSTQKVEPTNLLDQTKADTLSPRKGAGSSRSSARWIEEARARKEKALLALKAAKEEVLARQRLSKKGLSLEEKKKLRLARLQEAMERREAEAKRALEEIKEEADKAKRKSKERKKKEFYSDSSLSGDDDGETPALSEKGVMDGNHKTMNQSKDSPKLPASQPARNHYRQKGASPKDDDLYDDSSDNDGSDHSLGEEEKLPYYAEPFDSSSSESSSSEDSFDHNPPARKLPDESAYIVDTDPSSSETVCSDTSAEVARLKGDAMAVKAKKKNVPAKSTGNRDGDELLSPRTAKKNKEKAKSSAPKSPKKAKKTEIEKTIATRDSPKKSKKEEEDIKSPKSPKKSKKAEGFKSPKSPRKSAKNDKALKSPKKLKQKVVVIEKDADDAESSAISDVKTSNLISKVTNTATETLTGNKTLYADHVDQDDSLVSAGAVSAVTGKDSTIEPNTNA